MSVIKVIDLFAGPGGLGEGFSNCKMNSPFEIAMSVECDPHAHKTLTLRAFYRKLNPKGLKDYFHYIHSKTDKEKTARFSDLCKKYPEQWKLAQEETLVSPHALGNPEKWEMLKKGEHVTNNIKPTEQENRIFRKVKEIRNSHNGPLVVIGGPPCQSYSRIGQSRNHGISNYNPEHDERYYLYREYIKVIKAASPDIFIMENVDNITSVKLASGERIFSRIKKELRGSSRKPELHYDIYSLVTPYQEYSQATGPVYADDRDYIIKASDFGIPQRRKRVILLGIKKKYGPVLRQMRAPNHVSSPSIRELIQYLPSIRSRLGTKKDLIEDTQDNWQQCLQANLNTLVSILSDITEFSPRSSFSKTAPKGSNTIDDMFGFEDYSGIVSKIRNTHDEACHLFEELDVSSLPDSTGNDYFLAHNKNSLGKVFKRHYPDLYFWIYRRVNGVVNHGTRAHMKSDLLRYLFCSLWARANKHDPSPSPKSRFFPKSLAPDHKSWQKGQYADRFRAIEADQIPYTITSHLKKDGHAQIHYDPLQNRSLTAREAARIQTFPDDYYFEGPRGEQLHQVGNAVPSYLAKQIALHVLNIMKDKKIYS